jgi:exoribonuclease-2
MLKSKFIECILLCVIGILSTHAQSKTTVLIQSTDEDERINVSVDKSVYFQGGSSAGHFGLAVKDYVHSTEPNRQYPDLITQRLLKAAMAEGSIPYTTNELESLAKHCTENEDAAKKVERQVGKSAAAMVLESKINQRFDAIVTGASEKGTWVRLLHPPIEGRVVSGFEGLDVGHRCRVQLPHTDVERGYIDFRKVE